jgi:PAS domain S-box-containing protein
METPTATNSVIETSAQAHFREAREAIYRHTDRLFANLMIFQWLAGIVAALVISPRTWIGAVSHTHWHVWAAIFLGGAIISLPVYLAWHQPGRALTRHIIALAQMLFAALLIHLTGGRIETHFHIFGSLAFLAIYRDWKVLLTATVVAVIDHFTRGWWWPQSIFGVLTPNPWRWLEHAGWVLFEDTFLIISIRRSLGEMLEVATRRAKLEATNSLIETKVSERTQELTAAHLKLQGSERQFSSAFEYAAIGMALVSPTGRWLKVNLALCQLLGYPAAELHEMTFQDITHPGDLEADLQQMQQTLAGEIQSYQMEKRYLHREGEVVSVLLSVSLVRDAQGLPLHFISQLQNITERKEAETRLAVAHKELLELSRQAGMAEVATSVLHNVGNVLNSVNVSCSVVADRVRNSRVGSVAKTAALLDKHSHDLAAFVSDPSGRKLPAYLAKLAEQLSAERADVLQELQLLANNIDHIKQIVAMQQSFAKFSGVTETILLTDLVEDSLRMNEGSLANHSIQVIREYSKVPQIAIEKHKALQILINLVRNAKHACDDSGRPDKQIIMRVTAGQDCVRVAVIDNGVGIPPANLTDIFAHGFTTKQDGHGFGLHSGALAAREMGGSLTVHSAGTNTGATFVLELPAIPSIERNPTR